MNTTNKVSPPKAKNEPQFELTIMEEKICEKCEQKETADNFITIWNPSGVKKPGTVV
ncbi:MAG: hypothetical protein ACKVRN_11435 [Pyrinomonadaceae bacterium]